MSNVTLRNYNFSILGMSQTWMNSAMVLTYRNFTVVIVKGSGTCSLPMQFYSLFK